MSRKTGDFVEVSTENEKIKGRIINSKDKKLTLKLNSGYNIMIDEKKILSIKKLEKKTDKKIESRLRQNKSLPKIFILHTGGTIASSVSYDTGAVSPNFSPEDMLNKYPELKDMAYIESKLIFNKFSEDLRFEHYNRIAREIERIRNARGIIITHGTDTMVFTSAALSFALEGLPVPVILVGSQRSSDRPSSDSFLNLYLAIKFILET